VPPRTDPATQRVLVLLQALVPAWQPLAPLQLVSAARAQLAPLRMAHMLAAMPTSVAVELVAVNLHSSKPRGPPSRIFR
jgi:hypothetical protein